MTRNERLSEIGAGFLAGISGGFFGVGGGVIMIPILTGRFRLTQHQAHGTSLAVIGVTALVSLTVYALNHNVAWIAALTIGAATVLTAPLGARLAAKTSPQRLTRAFAAFIALVGLRLLWKTPEISGSMPSGVQGIASALALGLGVGLLSGYMGVGGGILVVPALTVFAGLPQQLAQGTSLAVIIFAAPAGALEHSRRGNVVWSLVPMLAIGAAIGGPLASWLAQGVPHALLVKIFAVFMLVNAVNMWIKAGKARGVAAAGGARTAATSDGDKSL